MTYTIRDQLMAPAAARIRMQGLALGAALLVAWSCCLQADAVGDDATPAAASQGPAVTRRASPIPVTHDDIGRWAEAWNSHNIETVLTLFDRQVVINQPSNPQPLDFEGARRFFTMIFRAYPDFHVSVTDAVVEGQTAISVERVTGTWLGPFIDPATGKTTPANGRKFDHPGVMVLKYGIDHKIKRVDIFWDRLVVNQQLGISP